MRRPAALLIVVGVFLFAAGTGAKLWDHYTSPDRLRAAATEQFGKHFNGRLTADSIHLSPRLLLSAGGLKVFPPGSVEPLLTCERATVQFDRSRFISGDVVPRRVVLYRPAVFVRYDAKDRLWTLQRLAKEQRGVTGAPIARELLADGFAIEDGSASVCVGELPASGRPLMVSGINVAGVRGFSGPERWHLSGSIRKGHLAGAALFGWYEAGKDGGFCLTCSADSLRVDKSLVLDIPSAGNNIWKLFQIDGPFALSATIRQSGTDGSPVCVASIQLRGCNTLTRYFPAVVSSVAGSLNISGNKVVFREVKGLIEPEALGFSKETEVPVEVRANGVYDIDSGEVRVEIEAANMFLCQRSIEAIPTSGSRIWAQLKPSGLADLRLWISDEPKKRTLARASVRVKDATISPSFLPVKLEAVTGTVEVLGDKATFRDVTAEIRPEALGLEADACRPVKVKLQGSLDLKSDDLQVDVEAAGVPLCQKLVEAIPEQGQRLWKELKPEGTVDLTLRVTVPGKGQPDYSGTVRLAGVKAHPVQLPAALENLAGEIDVRPGSIHFRDVTALVPQKDGPAHLTLDGTCDLELKNRKLKLEWRNLLATERFVRWLPDFGEDLWELLKPEGYTDASLLLNGSEKGKPSVSGQVKVCSARAVASFLPLPVGHLAGTVNIEGDSIQLSGFTGRFATETDTANEAANFGYFTLNGDYDVSTQRGSFQVDVPTLVVCEAVVKKVPSIGEKLWTILQPKGVAGVSARVVYDGKQKDALSYFVDVNLRNATARWNWCPVLLESVSGHVVLTEKVALLPAISGQMSGGWFNGAAFVQYAEGDKPLTYGATADFRRVDLPRLLEERLGRKFDVKGYLSGLLQLEGAEGPDGKMGGSGTVDLAEGYLWSIPVFMDIVEVLHLGIPSAESTFDAANMRFGLEKDGLDVLSLQIISRGTELTGRGTVGWDGKLNMAMVAATLPEGGLPIIGPAWRFILRPVEKELVKLTVTGTIEHPKVKPGVLAPLGRPIGSLYDLVSSPFKSDSKEEDEGKEGKE